MAWISPKPFTREDYGRLRQDLPARDRNVAMTFQFYALYPNLPVEDNLAYPLFAENLSKAEIAKRVERVCVARNRLRR